MQMDIGVRLLNEGTDVWGMMPAQHIAANLWVILDNALAEDIGCEPEFRPGNLVTVVDRTDAEGNVYPAAFRLYALPF
ncbi:MAG: hypothetical protein ACT4N8_12580 [Sphingosinicella sp.]|uniref:hypothetical protein n=1 Tax=Sphingosinicella sp. TaxID=1917971 RepID=UPI0040381588